MSQQLEIIVMMDIEAALKANSLEGNTYLFDNMKTHGSSGEGTGDLITAVNGAHWYDGSIAAEQVLNWLPYGIGTLPRTLPRGFQATQSKASDKKVIDGLKGRKGLKALTESLKKATKGKTPGELKLGNDVVEIQDITDSLDELLGGGGVFRCVKDLQGNVKTTLIKMVDVTGQLVSSEDMSAIYMPPVINDISGEAVDKGVIFPDQYGSPDLVNDGWYWAATVNTRITGVFAYTMHITLHQYSAKDQTWTPVQMTYTSYLNVTSEPKVNGFTGAGMGVLPV
ncbi:MAG: hypothetical protein ACI9C4_001274 [Paraglaciecola sp.]|jgi:hypothetical protein